MLVYKVIFKKYFLSYYFFRTFDSIILIYINNIILNTIILPIKFKFNLINFFSNIIVISQKNIVMEINVNDLNNIKLSNINKYKFITMYKDLFCYWDSLYGNLIITNLINSKRFIIYFSILKKNNFNFIYSFNDGIIIQIENSKYILIQF